LKFENLTFLHVHKSVYPFCQTKDSQGLPKIMPCFFDPASTWKRPLDIPGNYVIGSQTIAKGPCPLHVILDDKGVLSFFAIEGSSGGFAYETPAAAGPSTPGADMPLNIRIHTVKEISEFGCPFFSLLLVSQDFSNSGGFFFRFRYQGQRTTEIYAPKCWFKNAKLLAGWSEKAQDDDDEDSDGQDNADAQREDVEDDGSENEEDDYEDDEDESENLPVSDPLIFSVQSVPASEFEKNKPIPTSEYLKAQSGFFPEVNRASGTPMEPNIFQRGVNPSAAAPPAAAATQPFAASAAQPHGVPAAQYGWSAGLTASDPRTPGPPSAASFTPGPKAKPLPAEELGAKLFVGESRGNESFFPSLTQRRFAKSVL
jgi:hypothetical protein